MLAASAVLGLNAWAAAWPWFGRRLVTWSSYIVLTEPIPDRLADLGWTGGEGVADARFTLHYLRTTPDGRIALGGGGGTAGFGGRIGDVFTDSLDDVRRAAAGLRRLFPSLRRCPHRGRVGRADRHHERPPSVVRLRARAADPLRARLQRQRRRPFAWSRAGSSVRARVEASADPALALPLANGGAPRRFPPEPARFVGARLVREAAARRESIEERGESPSRLLRELSRLPRRIGYHLGPD